jgi:AcrR family transcriptional regulator
MASEARIEKLRSGHHGLSPEYVAQNQRDRLFEAMVAAVADKGYGEVTVADVLRLSGVSRRTFYDLFANKEECFLEAYDRVVGQLVKQVTEAFTGGDNWAERMRDGLRVLLDTLSTHPDAARVGLVEILAAGPAALERYDRAMRGFVPLLEQGREESRYGAQLPPNISEAVLGGMAQFLYLSVLKGETATLSESLDELLFFALVPFLGHESAAVVIAAP